MSDHDEEKSTGGLAGLADKLPIDRLRDEAGGMFSAVAQKGIEGISDRVKSLTENLTDFAEGDGVIGRAGKEGAEAAAEGDNPVVGALKGGLSGAKDKISGAFGGGRNKGASKSVNIIEYIDVGVPVGVAYDQWTQFADFPDFTRKVESVDTDDETTLKWKARILWSHRTWTASIVEQIPDERIIWKSQGEKGHVDGAVSFHEIGPQLTRIVLVLEYYPQGLFERTGNLWRAQGRRARSDLRHFARHVMTRSILETDDLEGWRGKIEDSEVVSEHGEYDEEMDHEDGDEESQGLGEDEAPEEDDEYSDAEGDEPEDEEPEDEEPAEDDEFEDEEPTDEDEEFEDEEPAEDEEFEDEEPADEDEDEEPAEDEEFADEEPAEDEEFEDEDALDEEEPEDEDDDEAADEAQEERPRRRRKSRS